MSVIGETARATTLPRAYDRALLPAFDGTLLVAALRHCSVQLLFTMMVLALLSGTPSVCSLALVLFRDTSVAGYAAVLVLTRWLDTRDAVVVDAALMLRENATLIVA